MHDDQHETKPEPRREARQAGLLDSLKPNESITIRRTTDGYEATKSGPDGIKKIYVGTAKPTL